MKTRPMLSDGAGMSNARWRARHCFDALMLVPALAGVFLFAETLMRPLRAVSCDPPPSGMVGWWTGDGTANDSVGGNNGALEGGAIATAVGLVGEAFSFDGTNGYVQIPNATSLNPTNFTVEAWVRFSSLNSAGSGSSPAGDQYIVFKQNSQTYSFEGIDVSKTRKAAGDVFRFLVTSASGVAAELDSTSPIATNVWYHVAAVRGSNFTQLYVNGQLVGQTNVTFAQNYGTLPLYFGTSGESYWDHKLAGNLDEVSLYNRPLASNEIAAIYAAGSAGKCKGAASNGPVIVSQPQSQSVAVGTNVSFTITASGAAPLVYQWQFNGAAISGATGASLQLSDVQSAQAGNYTVMVTNLYGSVSSAVATLTVNTMGTCDPPPSGMVGWWTGDGTANDSVGGNNGALEGGAMATAAGLVGEAFGFDGTNGYVQIPNAASLNPTNFTVEAWVRFSSLNSAGSGGSPAGDQYIVFKQNSQTGNFEGIDLSKTRKAAGDVFRFLVTSASGVAAELDSTSPIATNVWYHVAAVRGSNFTQLYVNGQLAGQTNVTFAQNYGTLPLYFGTSGESYWDHKLAGNLDEVSLYNRPLASNEIAAIYAAGSAGKCKAASGAIITVQPQSQTVSDGSSALFTVTAGGTAPLGYQWQFNGAAISGATGASLQLTDVQAAQAGNYTVLVSNSLASVTSAVATLTVVTGATAPAIVTQPVSQSVAAGANVSFSVAASGTAPLSYQWQFNGAKISGATSTSLTLNDVQSANAGNYAVVVSNSGGSIASATAVLSVAQPPPAGTITINGAVTYQTIDGFGANINHRSWNSTALPPVLNALINQGGLTLFHVIFDNNNWEATNDNGNANVMNWAYYNTVYSDAEFQKMWGIMGYLNQQGITNGLIPDFEGPVALWMGGLSLTAGMENEYAETIASLLYYARNTENLKFTVVGPVNEPDWTYSGINLPGGSSQYVTVMHDLAEQLNNNNMSDVRFSGPDLANTDTSWLGAIMSDPLVMGKFAHFGVHAYENTGSDQSGVSSYIQQSAYPGTHFWATECNVWCDSCQDGDGGNNTWAFAQGTAGWMLYLLSEGVSAGIVWEGYDSEYVEFNDQTGGNDAPSWSYWGLFAVNNINASPLTYSPRQGFYTMAQIALYVRPGAQRIEVNSSGSPLTVLAFYNTNNAQFTITGVNSNASSSTLSCALTSLPTIPGLNFIYTTSSTNLCNGGYVPVNNGAFSVVIPASSVFTLTYSNTAAKAVSRDALAAGAPHFLTPSVQNGNVHLSLAAPAGSKCQVEISTNLVDWEALTNIASTNGIIEFTDPSANGFQQRFYRAVLTK